MAHNSNHEHHHPREGSVSWYFYEFWPIMFFGVIFLIMCALPIILSGAFQEEYVFTMGEHELFGPYNAFPVYGLFILFSYALALVVMFVLPRLVGWVVFGLGVIALVLVQGVSDNTTALSWGPWVAIVWLGFVLFGNLFLTRIRGKK